MADITHVYVDMDGVLCSFSQGVLRLFGSPNPAEDDLLCRSWDGLPDVINRGRPYWSHVDDAQMMRAVRDAGHEFWADLPVTPWAYKLLGLLEEVCVPYTLLTTPAGGESAMGKFQWILKHVPHMEKRVVLAREKWHLAQPGRLLIDDGKHNIKAWRAHSGLGYLWPQPHNADDAINNQAGLDWAAYQALETVRDLIIGDL